MTKPVILAFGFWGSERSDLELYEDNVRKMHGMDHPPMLHDLMVESIDDAALLLHLQDILLLHEAECPLYHAIIASTVPHHVVASILDKLKSARQKFIMECAIPKWETLEIQHPTDGSRSFRSVRRATGAWARIAVND